MTSVINDFMLFILAFLLMIVGFSLAFYFRIDERKKAASLAALVTLAVCIPCVLSAAHLHLTLLVVHESEPQHRIVTIHDEEANPITSWDGSYRVMKNGDSLFFISESDSQKVVIMTEAMAQTSH